MCITLCFPVKCRLSVSLTRFYQVRPSPTTPSGVWVNHMQPSPHLISTPVWKVKQQHVSIMHFTSLRCQSEQLHPIWILSIYPTYSSLRWRWFQSPCDYSSTTHFCWFAQVVGWPNSGAQRCWAWRNCHNMCVPVYWVFTEHFSVYIDVYIRVVNVCPIFASWVVSSDSQLIINAALLISDANASCLMTE